MVVLHGRTHRMVVLRLQSISYSYGTKPSTHYFSRTVSVLTLPALAPTANACIGYSRPNVTGFWIDLKTVFLKRFVHDRLASQERYVDKKQVILSMTGLWCVFGLPLKTMNLFKASKP